MVSIYKSKYTGEQIDNSVGLTQENTATNGQVLTADGNGSASWQNATNNFYLHTIVTSNYTFYVVNKLEANYTPNNSQAKTLLNSIAFNRLIGYSLANKFYAYDIAIAINDGFDLTSYTDSPSIIQKGNAISYFTTDGQEETILSINFGTFVSDTATKIIIF